MQLNTSFYTLLYSSINVFRFERLVNIRSSTDTPVHE